MNVRIAGIGKCLPGVDLPGRIVTNQDVIDLLLGHGALKPGSDRPWTADELTPGLIENLVGIRQRHWVSPEVNTSDLALCAAEKALKAAGVGWEDIGIIIVGSSTPEALFPSTACLVLNKVLKNKVAAGEWTEHKTREKLRIPAYDVLGACTSGLYAADIVRKTLLSPENKKAYGLAVGAEVMSRMMDFTDTNSDLFGDGAGALVLERSEASRGIIWAETGSDPWGAETTYSFGHDTRFHESPVPQRIYLSGHEVQKYVLKIIPELILKTIHNANRGLGLNIKPEDIALFVCHQANARVFELPARKLGVPVERFYVNVERRGNCSSASVLMALAEAQEEGRLKRGDLVILLAFGGGLTWASLLVEA
jgi:3-oxoacyl-[acyl-carrier-protein] synthase-3